MGPIKIEIPSVLVLAEGKTDSDRDQAKGHLFEVFVAKLLHHYGFEAPTSSNVNVTSQGIELDVSSRHSLTNKRLVAECKAYSTNLKAKELTNFLGKLTAERYGDPTTVGLFIALPGLVAQGKEKLKQILTNDANFLAIQAEDLAKKLSEAKLIQDPPSTSEELSDPAIIITEPGIFSACKVLDPHTRRPTYARIWGMGAAIGAARDVLGDRHPKVFPQAAPIPSLEVLRFLAKVDKEPNLSRRAFAKAIYDLLALGVAVLGPRNQIVLAPPAVIDASGRPIPEMILPLLLKVPGGAAAIEALKSNPSIHRADVGSILEQGYQTSWSVYNRRNAGTYFRAWASIAGIRVTRSSNLPVQKKDASLFDELPPVSVASD